jgi:hypothetical protein
LESWEKKSRVLRKESNIYRSIRTINFILIDIYGKFIKTEYHNPIKFVTKNRKDIDLTVKFFKNILEDKISIEETLFFKKRCQDGSSPKNQKIHLKHLLDLCEEIKTNGMKKPIIVAKYNSPTIKIWKYSEGTHGEKIWSDFKNETGFQLIEGTHRLPIAIYLKIDKIPVKIYKPIFTQIPNFTEIFDIK